jgi:predicted peptidase
MIGRSTFFMILAALLAGCSNHANMRDHFVVRNVVVDGEPYDYRVFIPKERAPDSKPPVMLYLHGSNRRGTDNEAQVEDLADAIHYQPENFPYIIVFPQCRPDTFWAGQMTAQAMASLEQTVQEFNGDTNRLYLAGYSMGAFGSWQTAITFPDKFAAIIAVAGGIEPVGKVSDEDLAKLAPQVRSAAEAPDPYKVFAAALRTTPVWVVHGSKDEAVPVEGARRIVAALKAEGNANVNYVELDGVGHGSIGLAFSDPKLSEWLSQQHRSELK